MGRTGSDKWLCVSAQVAALLALTQTSCLADLHYLDAGIQNFNYGQFDSAMYEFKRAETANPKDPLVHYYMGSALARLNKPDDAYDEFRKVLAFAPPKSPIYQMARAALATLGASGPLQKMPTAPPKVEPEDAKALAKEVKKPADIDEALLQATGGIPKNGLLDSAENRKKKVDPLKQAVKAIHDQITSQEQAKLADGTAEARSRMNAAEAACADLQKRAKEQISEMQKQVIKGKDQDYHIYSQEDLADVQRKADQECEMIRRQARSSATRSSENAQEQALKVEETAKNLELQFRDHKLTGSGIRLMPHGTNLFTRNYETYRSRDDERASVIPLIAKPQKLNDLESGLNDKSKQQVLKRNSVLAPHMKPGAYSVGDTQNPTQNQN